MPLFVCDKCHAIDNTALNGNYWTRLIDKNPLHLCSECNTGQWHNQFTKHTYQPGDEKRPGGIAYIPKELT